MSANATDPIRTSGLPEVVNKIVLEALVDDLDELTRIAWNREDLDVDRLRVLVDESMLIAATLLEAAPSE